MSEPRRPILKRTSVWVAAFVLLLASYVASFPIALFLFTRYRISARSPMASRVATTIYKPLQSFAHSELPGGSTYRAYVSWCVHTLNQTANSSGAASTTSRANRTRTISD